VSAERDEPKWREDFPITWERDHYITRRELAKFLTLGSGILAIASAAIASIGARLGRAISTPRVRIASASQIESSLLFRYPTDEDPCIAVRGEDGRLHAYSQVCTHLSCAVVHRREENDLFCPCHDGCFSSEDGRPTAGPPTRPLPRVRLEIVGDEVYAVAKEEA
jgi:nitrite reductase/ring-hydroxylating ferredoxin subunit